MSGMDISTNLAPHQRQDFSPMEQGPLDFQEAQLLDKGETPRKLAPKSSQGRVIGGVSNCV